MNINNEKWEKNLKYDFIISKENDETTTAFSEEKQDRLYSVEDNSWWFKYRARVILNLSACYFEKNKEVVDIGGGNGFSSRFVQSEGYSVCLVEPSYAACINAKRRGVNKIYCGAISESSIYDNSISQAMLLDVIEHIECDEEFLRMIYRKLSPGGRCIITVPAFMNLWSSQDSFCGHFRRYTKEELEKKVVHLGFELLYSSYFMSFLYIPVLILRVWFEKLGLLKPAERRSAEERKNVMEAQFKTKNIIVDEILCYLQKREIQKLLSKDNIKRGSSLIVVVSKKK